MSSLKIGTVLSFSLLATLACPGSSWAAQSKLASEQVCPSQINISFVNVEALSPSEVGSSTSIAAAESSESARQALTQIQSLSFVGTLGNFDGACHYFTADDAHFPMGEITTKWGNSPTLHVTVFVGTQAYDLFVDLDSTSEDDVISIPSGVSVSITHQPSLDGADRTPYVRVGQAVVQ